MERFVKGDIVVVPFPFGNEYPTSDMLGMLGVIGKIFIIYCMEFQSLALQIRQSKLCHYIDKINM